MADTATLRKLFALAAAGGADPDWLRQVADQLVAQMLELEETRRLVNPRRRRTLKLARRVKALREKGVAAAALQARFGVSRTRIYQLLELSSFSLDNDGLSSAHEHLEKEVSENESN